MSFFAPIFVLGLPHCQIRNRLRWVIKSLLFSNRLNIQFKILLKAFLSHFPFSFLWFFVFKFMIQVSVFQKLTKSRPHLCNFLCFAQNYFRFRRFELIALVWGQQEFLVVANKETLCFRKQSFNHNPHFYLCLQKPIDFKFTLYPIHSFLDQSFFFLTSLTSAQNLRYLVRTAFAE